MPFDVRDLLFLSSITGVGPARLRTIVNHFQSPGAALAATAKQLHAAGGLDRKTCSAVAAAYRNPSMASLRRAIDDQLSRLNRQGGRIVTLWHKEYPANLRKIYDPPPILYVRYKPVYDVMRAVDFLTQHELVDPARIGAIGHSLGADTILWSIAFEERIQAAAISGGGIIAATWNPYGIPYADLLRLIAPRPFLEVTGTEDEVNWLERERPDEIAERMKGKRRAHAAGLETYRTYGCEERLVCMEFDGGHQFPEPARKAAYDWLKRWLVS